MILGSHGPIILAVYGLAVLVIAGLIGWVILDHRAQCRALDQLERQGVKRRSDGLKPRD